MGTGLGSVAKCAFRIESDLGLVSAVYPTTEATADLEEVVLGGSDMVPFTSEGVEEDHQWEPDETLVGTPAVSAIDRVAILGGGPLELSGMYDGLDALIACAMGFELPNSANSPAAQSGTALTHSAVVGGGTTWDDSGTPFTDTATDAGKFIQTLGAVAAEGQVRRITAVTDTNTCTVSPAWDQNPADTNTATMANEWLHLFELANSLHDLKFSVMDDTQSWTYPTTGVGTANDLCIRRGTLGLEKNQTKPWIYRACMVNSMTINAQAGSGITFSFELIPFNLDRDSATNTASTTWGFDYDSPLIDPAEGERIIFSDLSFVRVDSYSTSVSLSSADNQAINGFTLNLNNNLKGDDQDAVSGVYRVAPARGGFREVTGTFTFPRYDADTWSDWMDNKTILMAHLKFIGSTITNVARYFEIYICSFQVTGFSAPVSGAEVIGQTVNWRGFIPAGQPSGFPTQNQDDPRSEFMIRTLNQNPYNIFRDQNKEY